MESLQYLAADTLSRHVRADEDHGHVAVTGDDRSCAVIRAPRLSQSHGQHTLPGLGATDDQSRVGICELLPDPGHPGRTGRLESRSAPDLDGSIVICRKPVENAQVHSVIVLRMAQPDSLTCRRLRIGRAAGSEKPSAS